MRYVLLTVILYVMMYVSIFHNFTSLKLLNIFSFDMSTMVVTIQLMVDMVALFIQKFYNCSSNVSVLFLKLSNYLSLQHKCLTGKLS